MLSLTADAPATAPATAPANAHPPLSLWVGADDTVTFTNQSDELVTILLPIDGSDVGWRRVSYEWVPVVNSGGKPLPRGTTMRCGNVNALRRADFVSLDPGESYMFKRADTFLGRPTARQVKLVYEFDPNRPEKGVPLGPDEEVNDLLQTCPAVRVESNTLTVEAKQ